MRNVFVILGILLLLVAVFATLQTAWGGWSTPVTGYVYDYGRSAADAAVYVNCENDSDFVWSGPDGFYSAMVAADAGWCSVHAEKDGRSSGYFGFDAADGWFEQDLYLQWHFIDFGKAFVK